MWFLLFLLFLCGWSKEDESVFEGEGIEGCLCGETDALEAATEEES